mgnify:CR=1|jgi:hypothetical protein|tara:strand:- start:6220 stop:6372 length:153 start_codon:yes stop_codon:yes gene_type:complete
MAKQEEFILEGILNKKGAGEGQNQKHSTITKNSIKTIFNLKINNRYTKIF